MEILQLSIYNNLRQLDEHCLRPNGMTFHYSTSQQFTATCKQTFKKK